MNHGKNKEVVLAYSGGLDTSVILTWLRDTYDCEVVTFTADIGQGEELEPARAKAKKMGVKEIFIDDLKEEFVRDFVFPMFRANTLYEGEYLLGTSIARPLIAKRQIEIANKVGADAVSHGATGKGNDQVRFELGYYALRPDIRIIAPWREWDLTSREKLMAYAEKRGIPVEMKRGKKSPYSMDANLLHISYEGGILEDPWKEPEESMWRWTVAPEKAPNKARYIELTYKKAISARSTAKAMSPATVLATLEPARRRQRHRPHRHRREPLRRHEIARRYETPGGTIMLKAHRAIESITLDREVAHLKDDLMPRYAALIYNGYWWSPERRMLQEMIDASQATVNGAVRLKLYKGNVIVVGRKSDSDSLFDATIATFEDDAGAYNQKDAEGFIKLNALRMRIAAEAQAGQKMSFKNVEVKTKANVYHDGRVTSRTIITPEGEMKTLGVMLPGTYRFSTQAPEKIDVTQGHCRVKLADQQTWTDYQAGQSFSVPGNSHFEIEVIDLFDYVCHFG